jgi:NAD(P)-dependent dehydrogenase (short-subunit alcohol dehydrogenase family)
MLFNDKVALITGGSRGLGKAVAHKFAEGGARLILWARSQEKLDLVQQELQAKGAEVITRSVDLGDTAHMRECLEQAVSKWGKIDICINAAALPLISSFLNTTEEQYDRLFTVNTKGAFFLAQGVAKHMIEQKTGGAIIFISSVSGKTGPALGSVYSATKASLISFTQALSRELAPHTIRVNTVCPGAMDTDMLHRDTIAKVAELHGREPEKMLNALVNSIPIKRLLDPLEVAELIAFLASEKAGGITGQSINICGGTEFH